MYVKGKAAGGPGRGTAWVGAGLALGLLGGSLGCDRAAPGGALTRSQCAEMQRRIQRIESKETAAVGRAMEASLGAAIEGCLKRGTARAYRCVLRAQDRDDLESCERLFR